MKGTPRAFAALLLTMLAVASASTALAASDTTGNQISRWDAVWLLHDDGSATVQVEIDFDFGDDPGHGPYFTFPTEVDYGDGEHLRVYDIHDVSASSPTGAPAHAYVDESDGVMTVRIGDESVGNVSGIQTYVLRYTIEHVMNATTAEELGGTGDEVVQDEFYFNVIGDQWTIPISDVAVTVFADPEATEVLCWAGQTGATTACDSATTDGGMPMFTQSALGAYEGLTVAIAYPPGSFQTDPELVSSNLIARGVESLASSWAWIVWALGVVAVGVGLIVWHLRRTGRDDAFADVAPGLTPTWGTADQVTRRDTRAPVAVRFDPPPGVRPGQLGTVIDEEVDSRDIAATLVDLAVRGHLTIAPTETHEEDDDYTLARTSVARAGLLPYEQMLLDELFASRDEVTFEELRTTFSGSTAKVTAALYEDTMRLGWFRKNPHKQRVAWNAWGSFMMVVGIFGTIAGAMIGGSPLIALPFAIVGMVMLVTTSKVPARTAEGSRVLAQAQGFELYLRTAEADQIRFEEGQDIFSRYLPYAIAFGHAERWAKLFAELAARGVRMPEPSWYGGYASGMFWAGSAGLVDTIDTLETGMTSALTAPTPGSSGGSGFSGGSSGGGGGGGGGGGW